MKTRFRGKKEALEYTQRHRIGKERFITVHGKRMKVKNLKPREDNWTADLKLKHGELTSLGYKTDKSEIARHRALGRAIKKYGRNKVLKKINVLANLSVNKPKLHRIYKKDVEWIERE